jgi:DNA-directed RNA polymerase specialized sigma24 family protein
MDASKVEKLYAKHRDDLAMMCRAFKDWRSMEDKLSDANLAFMEACRSYDKKKSAFKTWLDRCVTNRLKEERERRFEFIQRYKQFELVLTYNRRWCGWEDESGESQVEDFRNRKPFSLEGLGRSAQLAVDLALKMVFARPKAKKGGTFKYTRLTYGKARTIVVGKLRRMGWSHNRIARVFARVQEAMRNR